MGENRKAITWIIIFMILVGTPSITYFFLREVADDLNYEQRNAAYTYFYQGQYNNVAKEKTVIPTTKKIPVLTKGNYESYPDEFEEFYHNNLPYKRLLIRINSMIDYYVFGQSSNESVVIGKDSWLFFKDAIITSTGRVLFSDSQLEQIASNLMLSKKILESQGVDFILFIAPNKETVYAEMLPDYYQSADITIVEQLIAYLRENTDIKIVYPKEELMSFKGDHPEIELYHKLDTHWNNAGGYIGAYALADLAGVSIPKLEDVSLKTFKFSNSDLTNMLGMPIKDADTDYSVSGYGEQSTILEKYDYETEIIYGTEHAEKTLVVNRDSFASAMAPHIAARFGNSYFVSEKSFKQQDIFEYGADIFVLERVERSIGSLENFHISYVNMEVKNAVKGKNIIISPAFSHIDLEYVSIFQKDDLGNVITVQELKPLRSEIVLQVEEDATGELFIWVYEDDSGEKIIETTGISY